MDQHLWSRPSSLPYPSIWSEFKKTDRNGTVLELQIQDLPEHLFSDCLDFMVKYFISDEPFFTCLGFADDCTSVNDLVDCWKEVLASKCTLICTHKNLECNTTDIIGVYMLYYHHKVHDDCDYSRKGEKYKALCDVATYVEKQTDRYRQFGIDDYLDEYGMCVHPKYRGLGIATEFQKARITLGAAMGLKYSFILCTAIASQKACEKSGFKILCEIDYNTLQKIFPHLSFNVKDTPSVRYMYIQHNP